MRPTKIKIPFHSHDIDQVSNVADDLSPRYKLGRWLGNGRHGIVREALDTKSGEKVAIKAVETDSLNNQEIAILKRVQHPNCIRLKKVEQTSKCTYLVMELCSGGEIFEKIEQNGPLPEPSAQKIALKLFEAVAHLHKNEIMHRGKLRLWFLFILLLIYLFIA